jgi:hypothetical protein
MSYKRLPKPHDRLRSQINWNTCILLVAVSIVIAIIILIELHIRRVTVHSGFPGSAISLGPEWLGIAGFPLLSLALVGESNA